MAGKEQTRFFDKPLLFFRKKVCKECDIVEDNLHEALVILNICQAILIIEIDNVKGREIAFQHGVVDSPQLVKGYSMIDEEDLLDKEKLMEKLLQ